MKVMAGPDDLPEPRRVAGQAAVQVPVSAPQAPEKSKTSPTRNGAEEQDEDSEADLKIILLGDSAVGKSKMVERYLRGNYEPHQLSTFALTVFRHQTSVGDQNVSVDFWDTAGQERFQSMHASYRVVTALLQ